MKKRATKVAATVCPCLGVFVTKEYRTCLALQRQDGYVEVLRMTQHEGLCVTRIPEPIFDRTYTPSANGTIERACASYVEFMRYLGATEEALVRLAQFHPISAQDMQTARQTLLNRRPATPVTSATSPVQKRSTSTLSGSPQSAAQFFKQLIMEGKLTDDQIFATVQEAFGLSDKKRGYVQWYRNHLKKTGATIPTITTIPIQSQKKKKEGRSHGKVKAR